MQVKNSKNLLSFILCVALIVAIALSAVGCGGKNSGEKGPQDEGGKDFVFIATDANGIETKFELNTDRETVGDALLDLDLIAGDEGEYGLYVKTVNGITLDYDNEGAYWAFYIDGEYAMTGVDSTEVEEGKTYSFKVEK